ncbi:trypsin-like peptidase domain-containing protein [Saccharothrix sp. S26]|uniref:trypsin-like peptidase domain-containing protein n=1 Tax=Saccharothrix sp. S26 TaxID=2907215 RepID=UPI00227900AD|nr:trypsin-like peptidase domain-containing protein [Saccharothrix sp. S26]
MRALPAAALSAPLAFGGPSSPEEPAFAVARPAVVLVTVEWHGWVRDKRTGEVFGGERGYAVRVTCSGAVIRPDGHVATASHCVHTGPLGGAGALFDAAVRDLAAVGRVADPVTAKAQLVEHAVAEGAGADRPIDRSIRVERVEETGAGPVRDVAPATVVDLVAPEDGDVAVLKVPREGLPSVAIRGDRVPDGTPVVAVGYVGAVDDPSVEPRGENGRVSGVRTREGRTFYEVGVTVAEGMGGGPVVDVEGRVVGVVSEGEARSSGLAAVSSTVLEVLVGKGVEAGQGAHDREYRGALDRYFAGDFDGAVEGFDEVLAVSPGHPQATEYRRRAVERGGSAGGGSTVLIALAVLCGGVGVATATAGTAMTLARRRRLVPVPEGSDVDGASTSGPRSER